MFEGILIVAISAAGFSVARDRCRNNCAIYSLIFVNEKKEGERYCCQIIETKMETSRLFSNDVLWLR